MKGRKEGIGRKRRKEGKMEGREEEKEGREEKEGSLGWGPTAIKCLS